MPLLAPGIGVVSGTDPVTVDILKFSGSLVSVSQSDDTMVVTIDTTSISGALSGGLKYPTYPIDDGFIQNILTATNATSSLWLVQDGTAPFYNGQTWWRDTSLTWKVREEVNVSGGNIFPTVQRFKFYDLNSGNVFQFHDTITYNNGVFEATRLRYVDGFQAPQFTLSPNTGTVLTVVTISGSNFMPGFTASVNPPLTLSNLNYSGATFTFPMLATGTHVVTGTNINGASGTASFLCVVSLPAITSILPLSGIIPGGAAVTVLGSAFITGAAVTFGTSSVTQTFINNTKIDVVSTPVHAYTGSVVITLTNPDSAKAYATATLITTDVISSASTIDLSMNYGAGGSDVYSNGFIFDPSQWSTYFGTSGYINCYPFSKGKIIYGFIEGVANLPALPRGAYFLYDFTISQGPYGGMRVNCDTYAVISGVGASTQSLMTSFNVGGDTGDWTRATANVQLRMDCTGTTVFYGHYEGANYVTNPPFPTVWSADVAYTGSNSSLSTSPLTASGYSYMSQQAGGKLTGSGGATVTVTNYSVSMSFNP